PLLREHLQRGRVRDPGGDALDDDVLAGGPAGGAERSGGDGDLLVGLEVAHLLLALAGHEGEGAVVPHPAERYGVGPAVGPPPDHPVELRVGEPALDVVPAGCGGARVAVAGVDVSGDHARTDPGLSPTSSV